jgi:hypothetical protein
LDGNSDWHTSNGPLIGLIAAVVGLNAVVLSSDLNDWIRYAVGGVGVIVLVLCVYKLGKNQWRS